MKKKIGKNPLNPSELVDKNNQNAQWPGKLCRDLDMGDRYEKEDRNGAVKIIEVKSKETTADGAIIIVTQEVSG